ncbi:hypothetical protein [Fluviibacter phosphoraccumulans]|uniref:hypothetical protein n=1 Tax=Fluviibacter phosphoraccumulans TaxID=1751046 RepID=UPI0010B24692|nr:hypothetical protein [Fluviibacter phosphoraccumulans]BCA64644.1 hypothetical protein SHINM1_002460 [Fluviibacter phosphoraccumulans]
MTWTVQRICTREDSVYLLKESSGVVRQISVPGAESAIIEDGNVVIRCKTGFSWSVNPETGARRRFQAAT